MNVREAVSFTIDSLRANKMRAGLTMLGMVIGTASIILVVTIALAGRDYILQQIQGVGSNLIYLYYEAGGTVSGARSLSDDLTLNDLEAIRSLPSVTTATAILQNHDRIMVGGEEREVNVIGTTPEYRRVRNLKILSGRFFDEIDDRSFNKVCLLTEGLARKLFASLDVRGRSVKFFQVRFAVIGVFKEGVETFGTSEVSAYSALIPMSVMSHFNTTDKVDLIYVSARSSALVPVATEQIRRLLAERHRSGSFYRVENLSEILKAAERIAVAMTIVLFLIGTISLIISGIGIMNIMLVTVTERTREIGIKMAIGARRKEILCQFLAESICMAVVGGLAGILLGVAGPLAAKFFTGFDIPISRVSIILAFSLSVIVGVIFGVIPANRAAKLNPTEALRYE
ncbi:MAG: hypothetical protein DMG08_23505 [Acidobacteria bacterium]|nr:MAG: hypothetical protein DMG08_23505 [Acidobacteriota bacterium]